MEGDGTAYPIRAKNADQFCIGVEDLQGVENLHFAGIEVLSS